MRYGSVSLSLLAVLAGTTCFVNTTAAQAQTNDASGIRQPVPARSDTDPSRTRQPATNQPVTIQPGSAPTNILPVPASSGGLFDPGLVRGTIAPAGTTPGSGGVAEDRSLFGGPIDPDTVDNPALDAPQQVGRGRRPRLRDGDIDSGLRPIQPRRALDGTIIQDDPAARADGDLDDDGQAYASDDPGLDDLAGLDADLRAEPRVTPELAFQPLPGEIFGPRDALGRIQQAGTRARQAPRPGPDDDLAVDGRTTTSHGSLGAGDIADPYAPLGVRMGAFTLFPLLTASTLYTDNVFNSTTNTQSDVALELRPSLSLESNWSRHALAFGVDGDFSFFREFDSENDVNVAATLRGRLDMTHRTNLELDASYLLTTEDRGSANVAATALDQPETQTLQAGIALNHRLNRLLLTGRAGYETELNADVALSGGAFDRGADEDFDRYTFGLRAGYEFSPSFTVFTAGTISRTTFGAANSVDGQFRDSDGIDVRIGFTANRGRVFESELSIGYIREAFDAAGAGDLSGVVVDGTLRWRPSDLTTWTISAASDVDPSDITGAFGSITQRVALDVRHAFRRHLIGKAGVDWAREEFEGATITETEWGARIGGQYLFSRGLAATAGYEFTDFNSSLPGSDYRNNEFRFGLQMRR